MSNAIIAWQNLLDSALSVVASSAEPLYPARNAWDGKTTTYWQPVGTGDHALVITFSAPVTSDVFCVFRHNLGTAEASIVLQSSDDAGATWDDCFAPLEPADNECVLQPHDAVSSDTWRILIEGSTAPVFLGVVLFGQKLVPYRGLPVGTGLAGDSRDVEVITSKAEGGAMVGRSVIPRGATQDIEMQFVPVDWVRDYWRPFKRHAESKPFFYSWNHSAYPEDCVYGEAQTPLPKDVQQEFKLYTLRLTMSCLLSGQ